MSREEYIELNILKLLHQWTNIATIIGSLVIIALSLLDYFVSPSNFKIFLLYRIVATFAIFLLYLFNKKRVDKNRHHVITIVAAVIVSTMVALMIAKFGGHESPYFAGIILTVIFVVGLAPLNIRMCIIASFIIYAIYLIPVLLYDTISNKSFFINANVFILSNIFAIILLRYLTHQRFVSEFGLQYDIEQQKEQLQVYSTQLEQLVKERTKELNKSEVMLKTLFENANDGIMIMDRNGIILNVNQKACEIHGFDRNALIGTSIELLEIEESKNLFRERMERILNGESFVFETQHYKKNGSKVSLEVSTRAVEIEGNILIQSFHRDITEKKQLQAQLFHSQKMESIGQLAGGIAHNFNNILAGILGHIELMRINDKLDEKVLKRLNVIEDSARKTSGMISKLLGFARRDKKYEILPFNLNDVVNDTAKLLERVIGKRISIRPELDNNIPLIEGDINQMEQIIMNLIVNARDAMSDGGLILIKTICVEAKKGLPDIPPYILEGRYVLLRISDTGCGIPEEIIDKIFEPFFTTKEQGKGTGLGLSMVYGAVKEHNGYITVQSKVNEGSIFDVYIPATDKIAPVDIRYRKNKVYQPLI